MDQRREGSKPDHHGVLRIDPDWTALVATRNNIHGSKQMASAKAVSNIDTADHK